MAEVPVVYFVPMRSVKKQSLELGGVIFSRELVFFLPQHQDGPLQFHAGQLLFGRESLILRGGNKVDLPGKQTIHVCFVTRLLYCP